MRIATVVFVLACFLAGCGGPSSSGGKTAEEWRAIATDLQTKLGLANADLRLAKQESVAPAADASVIENPCLRFSLTDVEGVAQQHKACVAWIDAFKKVAAENDTRERERRASAHKELWKDFPALMTQYIVLVDREQASTEMDQRSKIREEIDGLLERNAGFATLVNAKEYYAKNPEGELSRQIYNLEAIHKAFGDYFIDEYIEKVIQQRRAK